MDNETYKHIVLSYIPYGVQVQYEGILNGKEKSAYEREYDAKFKVSTYTDPPNYNPPADVVGLKLGLIKKVSFWKNYTNLEVGTKTHGLKRFALNLNTEPKFKLVLRPLSLELKLIPLKELKDEDVTKQLQLDGLTIFEIVKLINNQILVEEVSNNTIQLLCKNHVDYAGLIKKGFAVDINTLTK